MSEQIKTQALMDLLRLVDSTDLANPPATCFPMKCWKFDQDRNVVVFREGYPGHEVDLDDLDPFEVVDWIHHVGKKIWATPEITGRTMH